MDMSHQLFFEVMLIKWKAGGKRVFRSAHLYLSYTFVVLTCFAADSRWKFNANSSVKQYIHINNYIL